MDKILLNNPADIIQRDMLEGGVIRHTVDDENVSLNNLMAVGSRLAADVMGNRFICQVIVPHEFEDRVIEAAHARSIFPEFLSRDEFGGLTGLISQMALYTWEENHAVCHVPQFDLTWKIIIGDHHRLIKKEDAFLLTGPNKGFDLIIPYHPMLGYAPPQMLLQWIDEGYESPKAVLESFKLLPSQEKLRHLAHWEYNGFGNSKMLALKEGLVTPEDLKLLPEATPTWADLEEDHGVA